MSHMLPTVEYGTWWEIDGPAGTWYVPLEVIGIPGCVEETEFRLGITADNTTAEEWEEITTHLASYSENGARIWRVVILDGYGARFIAPGYMDATDWSVSETEREAHAHLQEQMDEEELREYYPEEYPIPYGVDEEPMRTWKAGSYRLELFDTNRTDEAGRDYLGYDFYHAGELIFTGADFSCSPLHAIDSDETVAALLGFLAMRPGDTDKEYFDTYTPKQLAFAQEHGEELGLLTEELQRSADTVS